MCSQKKAVSDNRENEVHEQTFTRSGPPSSAFGMAEKPAEYLQATPSQFESEDDPNQRESNSGIKQRSALITVTAASATDDLN